MFSTTRARCFILARSSVGITRYQFARHTHTRGGIRGTRDKVFRAAGASVTCSSWPPRRSAAPVARAGVLTCQRDCHSGAAQARTARGNCFLLLLLSPSGMLLVVVVVAFIFIFSMGTRGAYTIIAEQRAAGRGRARVAAAAKKRFIF